MDGASPGKNKKGAAGGSGSGSSSKYKMDLGPDDGKLEVVSPLADGLGACGIGVVISGGWACGATIE